MSNPTTVYWDSCCFIDRIEAINAARLITLKAMTDAAEQGALKIVTSALALAEVVKLNGIASSPSEKERMIVGFFANDYLHIRNVDPDISEIARELTRTHGLKPPDAIHVATALFYNVEVFHTYDDHLVGLDGVIRFPNEPAKKLKICHPHWEWQQIMAI